MTTTDEDEFSELVDAKFPRVDLVGKGANGVPRWLIAKQDADSAGLLPADYVRDLIAKAEPDQPGRERVEMANGITVSGSPADIAAFIHKAAVRAQECDAASISVEIDGTLGEDAAAHIADSVMRAVGKAEMSSKSINDLPDSDFAYIEPGGKKDESGKTTPRSLRHFPIHDAAHTRNALSRAPQSPFGDKAMPKIRSAAKKFGIDVAKEAAMAAAVAKDMGPELDDGVDGMDPTVPLAEPDEMGPGDPTDPGSPAWESIDAATACKWTSILARARVAVNVLAERELLEAASADPDDAENAWDLQDVCCAIDYAISVLAPFAVAEQSAADCGEAELAAIGKAMAADLSAPLGVVETFAAVRKAGRVLSSANEAAIRGAVESLQKVLASLPEAPVAKSAKSKEGTVPGTQTAGSAPAAAVAKEGTPAPPEAQAKDTGPVNAGGTTGLGELRATGPDAALPGDGPQKQLPGDVPGRTVVKALASALKVAVYDRDRQLVHVPASRIYDGIVKAAGDDEGKTTMQAVFDENGNLVGIVDPADITPVAGAGGKPAADDGDGTDDGEAQPGPAAAAAAADDMTPQPAADAGTPADDVAKTAGGNRDAVTMQDVLKSITDGQAASAAHQAALLEAVAKMAAGNEELTAQVETLKARLTVVEEHPAAPRVFANGQVPPAHMLRGQDQGAPKPVDVAKAAELKQRLSSGAATPAEQNEAWRELMGMSIAKLTEIRAS